MRESNLECLRKSYKERAKEIYILRERERGNERDRGRLGEIEKNRVRGRESYSERFRECKIERKIGRDRVTQIEGQRQRERTRCLTF